MVTSSSDLVLLDGVAHRMEERQQTLIQDSDRDLCPVQERNSFRFIGERGRAYGIRSTGEIGVLIS